MVLLRVNSLEDGRFIKTFIWIPQPGGRRTEFFETAISLKLGMVFLLLPARTAYS